MHFSDLSSYLFPGSAWRSLLNRPRYALAPIAVLFNGTFSATASRLTAAAGGSEKATSIGMMIQMNPYFRDLAVLSDIYWSRVQPIRANESTNLYMHTSIRTHTHPLFGQGKFRLIRQAPEVLDLGI